ncbi:hypothetical protein AAC387_Pa03g1431 [Persea americana]
MLNPIRQRLIFLLVVAVSSPIKASMTPKANSDYKLTDEETKLLDQFWDDYCKRADKLSIYCTSPTSKRLKKLLSREWMETGLLQNWFDVYLKPKAPHAYFIDANASDIWLKQSKERYVHIFGEFGWRVDIMKKHEVIVIPMCYLEHFTVIMGYPKEGKWEYYNSMPMDKRQWPKAEEFIIWLNDSFADFGWEGPRVWGLMRVEMTKTGLQQLHDLRYHELVAGFQWVTFVTLLRPIDEWHVVLEVLKRLNEDVDAFEDPFVFSEKTNENALASALRDDIIGNEEGHQ